MRLEQAKAYSGMSPNTLRQLADEGVVVCGRTPGGHRRWDRESIDAYLTRDDSEALAIARSLGL